MKRTVFVILLVLVGVVLPASAQERVIIALGTDAASLDPQLGTDAFSQSILANVFDPLIYRENDLSLVAGLATAWEALDDTTWQLNLREGVIFHNGEAFTSEDVKFTLERPLNPDFGSPWASRFTVLDSVEIIDDYTVLVKTKAPYPLLPARLSEWYILPKDYVEATDPAIVVIAPVGTGAYAFVEWVKDDHLNLVAFSDHWRGAPAVQNVTFRPIPEQATRVAALQAGDVDLISNVPAYQRAEVEDSDGLSVRAVPSTFFQYVALDGTKNAVLADKRVRQAIQYATNVPEIVEFLFNGDALQIAVPLAFGTFGLDTTIEPYAYDPDRARELLLEAGYPNGITFAMDAPVGRYAQDKETAEALVGQWSQVGINVELNVNAWADQLAKYRDGTALVESHFMGWGTSTFDADDVFFSGFAVNPNKNNYVNEELTAIVTEARSTLDEARRLDLYAQAQAIIYDEVPWLFLFQQVDLYGVRTELAWEPREDQKIEARTISIAQ